MGKMIEGCLAGATLGSIFGGSVCAIFSAITLNLLGIHLVQNVSLVLSATTINVILGVAMGAVIGMVAGTIIGATKVQSTTCNAEEEGEKS